MLVIEPGWPEPALEFLVLRAPPLLPLSDLRKDPARDQLRDGKGGLRRTPDRNRDMAGQHGRRNRKLRPCRRPPLIPRHAGDTRGTQVLLRPARRLLRTRAQQTGITLAGLPVLLIDESKHFMLIGTTGSGKSTAIREVLRRALHRGSGDHRRP